jgi:hypothetical protein
VILKYIKNLLIALDQLVNTICGGDPDETISSRAAKWHPWLAVIIDRLFFWQPNHCEQSVEAGEGSDAVIE